MSGTTSTETTTETAPKKGRKLILIILPLLLCLIGGGVYGFFYLRSSAAENDKSAKSEKATEEDSESEDAEESEKPEQKKSGRKNAALKEALPNDEDVKNVVELQPFVVNLTDPEHDRYLRLTVSVGVGEDDGGHGKPDPLFITRVRNAMLAVLTLKNSEDVLTVEGKSKLRKELLKAAQAASEHPHVEAIYITDFIVQL